MRERELTNREILIMKCAWSSEKELSVQEMQGRLKEQFCWDAKSSRIRTFLVDMEGKGFIAIERRGRHSYIKVLAEEDEYKKTQTAKMLDFWFDGSSQKLISALTNEVTEDSVDHLMGVLDELGDD